VTNRAIPIPAKPAQRQSSQLDRRLGQAIPQPGQPNQQSGKQEHQQEWQEQQLGQTWHRLNRNWWWSEVVDAQSQPAADINPNAQDADTLQSQLAAAEQTDQLSLFSSDLSTDVVFAEIELAQPKRFELTGKTAGIESLHGNTTSSTNTAVNINQAAPLVTKLAQLIDQKAADPVQQTFRAMRALAASSIAGRTGSASDAGIFYLQATFMQDFTDNFAEVVPFQAYYPTYLHMNYQQLRTYFTWRTKVRSGIIEQTSLSYVYVYIYELLANVGASSYEDSLEKLMTLWLAYREFEPQLDTNLPDWLRDYHIYYPLAESFESFVAKKKLTRFYPDLFLYDTNNADILLPWSCISSYDANKSKFVEAGYSELLKECFAYVIKQLSELCVSHDMAFDELFLFSVSRGSGWVPFQRAVFYPWLEQSDREVILPNHMQFFHKNNHWTHNYPMLFQYRRAVAGYLIKKTEACLRKLTGYKHRIKADTSPMLSMHTLLQKTGMKVLDFDAFIEQAADDFYLDKTKIVVEVDLTNLQRIRAEALGTQQKLIVQENDEAGSAGAENADAVATATPSNAAAPPQPPSGWATLREALTSVEREALSLILTGCSDGDVKALADGSGMMLEVLIDSINEKSMDHISDNLLDFVGAIEIYDDYRDSIIRMLQ